MRTLWIVLGGLAAAATAGAVVYVVRNRRREVESADDMVPFDIVEAELIEVEATPVITISVADPSPNDPVSRRY